MACLTGHTLKSILTVMSLWIMFTDKSGLILMVGEIMNQ